MSNNQYRSELRPFPTPLNWSAEDCYDWPMTNEEEKAIFAAYSRGKISRAEVARRSGRDMSFGDLLGKLREHRLTLPRHPSDPQSPGAKLIRALLAQASDTRPHNG